MGERERVGWAGWARPGSLTPPLHLQVSAFAAAVKRGEKSAELNRMLSPFTAGDYTRPEFNALFTTVLNAERASSHQIGPEKLVQATRPTPSNPTTLRTQHTHRHGARPGWRLTPPPLPRTTGLKGPVAACEAAPQDVGRRRCAGG